MDLRFRLAVPATAWLQPCVSCGEQIQDGSDGIEVELKWEDLEGSSFCFRRVWYQQCHSLYLDDGEET